MSHATVMERRRRQSVLRESLKLCAFCELLGMEIAATGEGYVRLTMPVVESLLQPYGVVHGGAIASLADTAAGMALLSAYGEKQPVTIELKLNYVRPALKGTLVAEARLFHQGRSTALADIEVRDEDAQLVAKGIATLLPLRREDPE